MRKVRDPGSIVRRNERCYNSVVFDDLTPLIAAIARAAMPPGKLVLYEQDAVIIAHAIVGREHLLWGR